MLGQCFVVPLLSPCQPGREDLRPQFTGKAAIRTGHSEFVGTPGLDPRLISLCQAASSKYSFFVHLFMPFYILSFSLCSFSLESLSGH